jgi:hypothetical protein
MTKKINKDPKPTARTVARRQELAGAVTTEAIKPKMPEEGIIKEVVVCVPVRLTSDFNRYSNGTILMSITRATFTLPDGRTGSIHVSVGGDSAEIEFGGKRSWNVKLNPLVDAALEAEKIYLAEVL